MYSLLYITHLFIHLFDTRRSPADRLAKRRQIITNKKTKTNKKKQDN